jgi:hypothetical protein
VKNRTSSYKQGSMLVYSGLKPLLRALAVGR